MLGHDDRERLTGALRRVNSGRKILGIFGGLSWVALIEAAWQLFVLWQERRYPADAPPGSLAAASRIDPDVRAAFLAEFGGGE